MNNRLQSVLMACVAFGVLELVSLLKINILFGANKALFSGFSIGAPLMGLYAGMGIGAGLFFFRRIVHCLFMGTSLFSPFSLYLPTMAAGYYFKSTSWVIRLAVPLACMVLFVIHPVGGHAWYYSMYWLVPVLLFMAQKRSQFTEALGATFVQHAVGSVVWLYCMPTTAAVWVALMPIVAVERLACAFGMVSVMHLVAYTQSIRFEKLFSFKHVSSKI